MTELLLQIKLPNICCLLWKLLNCKGSVCFSSWTLSISTLSILVDWLWCHSVAQLSNTIITMWADLPADLFSLWLMHRIPKWQQAANKTVFEVCRSQICPYQAGVRARRLSNRVLCPLFHTRSPVLITCGGCDHKERRWDVFPLIKCIFTPPPSSSPLFAFSAYFCAASPQTPRALLSRWQMVWLSAGKQASLMSTKSFLAYLVFQWLAVNLTASKWEERNSRGSLMIKAAWSSFGFLSECL